MRYDTAADTAPPTVRGRGGRPLLAALAVLVCAALAVSGWLIFGGRGGGTPQAHDGPSGGTTPPARTATDQPTASGGETSPSDSGSATASGPPAGYTVTRDDYGFTAALPNGWTRTVQPDSTDGGGQVFFSPDGQRHLIEIGVVKNATGTPYDQFKDMEKQLAQRSGYRLHRFDHLDADPRGPVEIEFSYHHGTLGPRHVIDRGFYGPGGVFYAVLVAGPEDEWAQSLATYRVVVGSFCATGYCGDHSSASTSAM